MRALAAIAVAVLAALAAAALARADTIALRSGERLEGSIVAELDGRTMIKLADGSTRWVASREIASVSRTAAPRPEGDPCAACGGAKSVACSACQICPQCAGKKTPTCYACPKPQKKSCAECGGKGKITKARRVIGVGGGGGGGAEKYTVTCDACAGRGHTVVKETCETCSGRGSYECPICYGTGFAPPCTICGGTNRLACAVCAGSGRQAPGKPLDRVLIDDAVATLADATLTQLQYEQRARAIVGRPVEATLQVGQVAANGHLGYNVSGHTGTIQVLCAVPPSFRDLVAALKPGDRIRVVGPLRLVNITHATIAAERLEPAK